ncbi:MAG TPA: cyclopropane-fatty-acyl-phospholipid synthase family protein [Methylotenera sp.]|nr:cyclopropane-fatty-acyl-phospholipid synthase family protein [Methylotenera sp.]
MSLAIKLAESGNLPDSIVRQGIRQLVKQRLKEISADNCETGMARLSEFVAGMNNSPIAPLPELANAQHYEVPAEFFHYCLGEHRKYSSCFWISDTQSLYEAEKLALSQTCVHADLQDGQHILELGCGWGSLSLWMAAEYPNASITGVSNSNSQREYIMNTANSRGITNLNIITADMNTFEAPATYDRIVSVEMFEHMRNYQMLYGKVASWLKPQGKFFKHIFVHCNTPYAFDVKADDDWMSQFFFSGGMMPSDDLPLHFQDHLKLTQRWRWDGTHYEKTANAWLENMDKNAKAITPILAATYGENDVEMWRNRWRMFYMACAELFGYNNGQEWWVTHYLFEKR